MNTERNHRADALLLISCSFAVATSNSVIFAALGDLQDKYKFADSGLGFIAGAGFLSGFLVQLFVAPFADRGHTKRLIMMGMVIGAFGSLLMATGSSLPQFVLARAVIGSSFGFVFPAVRALVACRVCIIWSGEPAFHVHHFIPLFPSSSYFNRLSQTKF